MKQTLFLLLTILLVSQFYCQLSECQKKTSAKKKKECNDLKVSDGMYKCCYVKLKSKVGGISIDYEGCQEIDKNSYDNIDDMIKKAEKDAKDAGGEYDLDTYDCNSNYLLISIMSLILLLFL